MTNATFTFNAKQSALILTAAQASTKTRKEMLPIAHEWRAANGAKQEAMCKAYMVLWIQGYAHCDEEQAEIILSAGKGKHVAINPAAIDAARFAFRYNVIKNGVVEQEEVKVVKPSSHKPVKAASKAEAAIIKLVMDSMSKARALELLAAIK